MTRRSLIKMMALIPFAGSAASLQSCYSTTNQLSKARNQFIVLLGPPKCGKTSLAKEIASCALNPTCIIEGDKLWDRDFVWGLLNNGRDVIGVGSVPRGYCFHDRGFEGAFDISAFLCGVADQVVAVDRVFYQQPKKIWACRTMVDRSGFVHPGQWLWSSTWSRSFFKIGKAC